MVAAHYREQAEKMDGQIGLSVKDSRRRFLVSDPPYWTDPHNILYWTLYSALTTLFGSALHGERGVSTHKVSS